MRVFSLKKTQVTACVTGGHAAFKDHYGLGLPNLHLWHAGDRAFRIFQSIRIHNIVSANHKHDIHFRQIGINLFAAEHDIVRHISLGWRTFMCPGKRPATSWIPK